MRTIPNLFYFCSTSTEVAGMCSKVPAVGCAGEANAPDINFINKDSATWSRGSKEMGPVAGRHGYPS
jgi:hypothetical protein